MHYSIVRCPFCGGSQSHNLGASVTGFTLDGPIIQDSYCRCGFCSRLEGRVLAVSDGVTTGFCDWQESKLHFDDYDETPLHMREKLQEDFSVAVLDYYTDNKDESEKVLQGKLDALIHEDMPEWFLELTESSLKLTWSYGYGEHMYVPLWLAVIPDITTLLLERYGQ